IWMAEVAHESSKVWSSKPLTAVFLSSMRHYRGTLRARGWRISSGKPSSGVSMCEVSTGRICQTMRPLMHSNPCPGSTGPARPGWPACAMPSAKR
ncbi:MAG: cryptochrome/photolyase family protein, partial [Verrucomicrobiales bacterium]|nr:cryptochrome/photolyase family protein [Verrucomicrobiales bacterium]